MWNPHRVICNSALATGLAACLLLAGGCSGPTPPPPESNPFGQVSRTAPPAPVQSAASSSQDASKGDREENASSPPVEPSEPVSPERGSSDSDASRTAEIAPDGLESSVASSSDALGGTRFAPPPDPQAEPLGHWTQFRGPEGGGVSRETGLPVGWSETENLVWKTRLTGWGASSPVVYRNRVFVTYYKGYGTGSGGSPRNLSQHVACFDRQTGRQLWESRAPSGTGSVRPYGGFVALHGYASSTPVTDGRRVFTFFGNNGVTAWSADDGRRVWNAAVGDGTHDWGSGTSPILYRNLLIVNAAVESNSLKAFDRETGEPVWTVSGIRESWATPVLVGVPDVRTELVISMQGRLRAVDPLSGDDLWTCAGIDDYVCPSVIAADGVVYAIGGRSGQALAVRAGGEGDVTDTHVLWRMRRGSNVTSPVLHDGHLYWVSDAGIAFCLNAASGEQAGQQRLGSGDVYASVVLADDKLYAVSRQNGTFVLSATPELEVLAQNKFDSDRTIFNGSPAVHQGCLLLRSDQNLYCVGDAAASNP